MHDRISVGQEYSTTSSSVLAKQFPLKKSIKSEFYHLVHYPFLVCTIGNTVRSYNLEIDQTALQILCYYNPFDGKFLTVILPRRSEQMVTYTALLLAW